MDKTIKDLRKFIIKEVISADWSTENRKDFFSTKYISIKQPFDEEGWCFRLNGDVDKFYTFKSIGINKFILFFLFLFIKRNIKINEKKRKNDVLKNEWGRFLDDNKDLSRDKKIDKIINK